MKKKKQKKTYIYTLSCEICCSFVDLKFASGDLQTIWVPTWICSLCEKHVKAAYVEGALYNCRYHR